MTSMPLTSRRTLRSLMVLRSSGSTVGGVASVQLLLGRVFLACRLDHRLDDLLVGLVPVGADVPLGAVPRLDARPARTHVVVARGADRPQHTREAERVELLLVEREVLQPPAHLLAGHDLALAETLLRAPHRLDAEHLDDD